jgi:hypothetical protein
MSTILDTIAGGLLGGIAAKFNTKGDKGSAVHQSNQYNIERLAQLNTVYSSMGEGYLRVDEVFGEVSGQKNGEPQTLSELFGAKESIVTIIKKDLADLNGGTEIEDSNKNLRRLANLFNTFQSKDRYLVDKYELFEDLTKSGKFYELPKILQDKLTPSTMERMGYEILTNQDTNLTLSINLTKMQNLIQTGIFIINGNEFLRDDLYTSEVTNREVKDAGTTFDKSAVLSYIKKIDPSLEKEFDRNFTDVVLEKTDFAQNLSEGEKVEVRKILKEKGLDKNFSEALQIIGTESVSGLTGGYGHDVAYINYMGYFHGETFFTTQAHMVGKWCKEIFDVEGVRTLKAWEAGNDSSIDPETGYSSNEIPIIKKDLLVEGKDGKMHRLPSEFYSAKEYFLSHEINANTRDLYEFEYDAYRQLKDGVPADEIKLTKRDLLYFTMIETSAEAHHNMNSSRDFAKTATLMTEALEIAISSGEISLPKSLAQLDDTYKSNYSDDKTNSLKGTIENPVTFTNEHIARFTCGVAEAAGNVKGSMLYERASKEGKIRATAKYIGKEKKSKPGSRRQDPIIIRRVSEELDDPKIPSPKWREQYKYLALVSEQIVDQPQNAAAVGTGQVAKEGVDKVLNTVAAPFKAKEGSVWKQSEDKLSQSIAKKERILEQTNTNEGGSDSKENANASEDNNNKEEQSLPNPTLLKASIFWGKTKLFIAKNIGKIVLTGAVVGVGAATGTLPIIAAGAAGIAAVGASGYGGYKIMKKLHGGLHTKVLGAVTGIGLSVMGLTKGYDAIQPPVKELDNKEVTNWSNRNLLSEDHAYEIMKKDSVITLNPSDYKYTEGGKDYSITILINQKAFAVNKKSEIEVKKGDLVHYRIQDADKFLFNGVEGATKVISATDLIDKFSKNTEVEASKQRFERESDEKPWEKVDNNFFIKEVKLNEQLITK